MSNTLSSISSEISGIVGRTASSIVVIHGNRRPRLSTSGVVWRAGLIITTDAGMRRDEDVQVTLPDGVKVPATLKGRDPSTDLALLACDTGSAVPAAFSDTAVKPGELVLTVGRTVNTGPIVTMGIVSGVSGEWRTWRGVKLDEFVRLDASTRFGPPIALCSSSGRLFLLLRTRIAGWV